MASKIKDLPFTPSEGYAFILKYETTLAASSFGKGGGVIRIFKIEGDTQYASISNDQVTIQPGTYIISGVIDIGSSGIANVYLRLAGDISNSGIKVPGAANVADSGMNLAFPIEGVLTVETETVYELFCSSGLGGNMGKQCSFGVVEVYNAVAFIRI